jgi:hypothetical protein
MKAPPCIAAASAQRFAPASVLALRARRGQHESPVQVLAVPHDGLLGVDAEAGAVMNLVDQQDGE